MLVVNDMPDALALMSQLLSKSGYHVLTAADGHEGFEVARAERPDLIVSDVSMPRLDGIEMCRLIREQPGLRSTPVLLVSAIRRDGESVVEGLKAGADDYLEAPYDPMRLITRVAQLIERKRAEEALRESADQLRQAQKLEAVGQLAGGIAHDFNNLLVVINGYSELTIRRLPAGDPLRLNVEEIRKAGERAASLTRQLLAFSRKQVLQPKVIDLNEVVRETEKMLRRLIGEDIELRAVPGPGLGSVKADPGQIEQVLLNLAVNARDAMPRGGRLTIGTENVILDEEYSAHHISVKPGRYVMLAVSDTGSGMDEATRTRIFEPFFTTKEAGKGTGLGLSTVYGIVKQSGGNVWVYSEVGVGTTFKIYLPRVDEETQGYRQTPEPAEGLRGTETILLAEDDKMVRTMTRVILSGLGYRVLEAENGAVALSIFERDEEPIHLLLTDVVMPGLSGRELADHLGRLRPEVKVLFMSGYTDDAIVYHGVLDEGVNFIQKPFAPDSLARKVREVLSNE